MPFPELFNGIIENIDRDEWSRTLLDSIPGMVWITNSSRECIYVNQRWIDFTGRSFESYMGDGWISSIHPDDQLATVELFYQSYDRRETFELQIRVTGHDGSWRWIINRGAPIYFDGILFGFIGTCIDITPRVRALEKLAESDHLHRLVTQNYPGMISLVDRNYRYILAHGQALESMGLDETAFPGQVIGFRGANGFTDQIREVIKRALAGESQKGELTSDGQIHEYHSVPIKGDDGAVASVLTHTWDVTAERKLQHERDAAIERAQQALNVRNDFMSTAAHELRTPLTTSLGYLQLLYERLQARNGLEDDEERYFKVALGQFERLSLMVASILDITRIDRGVLSIDRRTMNISESLNRVVDEMATTTTIHTFKCEIPMGRKSIYLNADVLRMEQVFRNVISNAIKYSPKGGTIDTSLFVEDGYAVIKVQDSGIGVPQNELDRVVHERFYRASNVGSVQTGITGLGIGLVVANQIIEMHGGTLTLESEGHGRGTTAIIRMPMWSKN